MRTTAVAEVGSSAPVAQAIASPAESRTRVGRPGRKLPVRSRRRLPRAGPRTAYPSMAASRRGGTARAALTSAAERRPTARPIAIRSTGQLANRARSIEDRARSRGTKRGDSRPARSRPVVRRRPRVIQVVGRSGSGKTLLVEGLVRRLRARGFRVAVLKHSHHSPDLSGSDTSRFTAAGADWVGFAGRRSFVLQRGNLLPVIGTLPVDVVLIEGYSRRRLGDPRVTLSTPRQVPDELRAILASDWAARPSGGRASPRSPTPRAAVRRRGAPPVRRAYLLLGHARRLPGKFYLPVGGRSVLDREVQLLRRLRLRVELVAVEPPTNPSVPVVADQYDRGPLGGLATAVERTSGPFLLLAADLPGLDPRAVRAVLDAFDGRCTIPRDRSGTPQVLHAVYAGLRPADLAGPLRRGEGLQSVVRRLDRRGRVRWVDGRAFRPDTFRDIDTPEDYRRYVARRAPRRRPSDK